MTADATDTRATLVGWQPRRRPGVEVLDADDQVVLWGDAVAVPVLLPAVEAVLWDAVDGRTPVGELVDDLVSVFGATAERAGTDLERLLASWWHLGLLDAPPDALVAHWQLPGQPPEGPDATDHPLQSPAVLPPPALGDFVGAHGPTKLVVHAGALDFAVTVEEEALLELLRRRVAPAARAGDARWRYAALRERTAGATDPPLLVLSDIGLPLLRTHDLDEVVRALSRRISHVVDLATPGDVAWFRLHAVVRDGTAVLLQHEFLHAYPPLDAGLRSRGFELVQADHVAIDPGSGEVVLHADRFDGTAATIDGPAAIEARCSLVGTVLAGGPQVGPVPATPAEWRWLLSLYSVIGHEPRADSWRDRWRATAHLVDAACELVDAFDAATVLAAVDRLGGDRVTT
jgi:hypothetical protein